jgi:hypothetical protein
MWQPLFAYFEIMHQIAVVFDDFCEFFVHLIALVYNDYFCVGRDVFNEIFKCVAQQLAAIVCGNYYRSFYHKI